MIEPAHTPDWVQDAIFYQIFPDRFAVSPAVPKLSNLERWDAPPTLHGFKGGDLLGVAERLDYLQDLGITAIYFTPIFQSTANHRYHTHDYYRVDPILGGNEALRILLEAAHGRGMRVVLDGVFNHASRGFFQFNHILENGEASPYIDWFTVHGYPMGAYEPRHQYKGWIGLAALPEFNTETPAVREFLWNIGRYWIDFGIDGWRLDVPNEIDDDAFWREFRRRVKDGNPEAYIVGEIWEEARRWLQGDQFDAVMNYLFTRACAAFFIRDFDRSVVRAIGPHRVRKINARGFGKAIDELLALYSPGVTGVQLNLLDSHDMPRFLTLARGDDTALRLATLFQMTYPGAPSIYYGDEIGFGAAVPPGARPRYDTASDPDTRRAFPWDERQWNHTLRAHFKQCIALRKAHPALRRGAFTPLMGKGSVYAFERHLPDETMVVALNVGEEPVRVSLPAGPHAPEGAELAPALQGEVAHVIRGRIEGGFVPARSGVVWKVVSPQVANGAGAQGPLS